MAVRRVDFEARLGVAIECRARFRSRATGFPSTIIQRQRGDHRNGRSFDSTSPGSILAALTILSEGGGTLDAIAAASGSSGGPPHWKFETP
jgi:hypothetical protein